MILRCTARLLTLLGTQAATLNDAPPDDDDWYANLLWIDRRKCLLLMHAGSLFPVFILDVRKSDLRPLGPVLVGSIEAALADERLPLDSLGTLDPDALAITRTASRQVLGYINDTAHLCRYDVEASGGIAGTDVRALNRRLRRTLHDRDGHRTALDLVEQRRRDRLARSGMAARLLEDRGREPR